MGLNGIIMFKNMKKVLVLMILSLFSISQLKAQNVLWFKATSFSIKYADSYGNWTKYSKWIEIDPMPVKIDLIDDIIIIYSNDQQIYLVKSCSKERRDRDGGTQIEMRVVDQDLDWGIVRLRKTREGDLQLYVDFTDIAWVYNIE